VKTSIQAARLHTNIHPRLQSRPRHSPIEKSNVKFLSFCFMNG
jgi:hypothetical protein